MNDSKFGFSKIFWGGAWLASPQTSPLFGLRPRKLSFDSRPQFGFRPQLSIEELGLTIKINSRIRPKLAQRLPPFEIPGYVPDYSHRA